VVLRRGDLIPAHLYGAQGLFHGSAGKKGLTLEGPAGQLVGAKEKKKRSGARFGGSEKRAEGGNRGGDFLKGKFQRNNEKKKKKKKKKKQKKSRALAVS